MKLGSKCAFACLVALVMASSAPAQDWSFRHFAGYPSGSGYADGQTPQQAMFKGVSAVAVSPDGIAYIADTGNSLIRRVDTDGTVSTLVGYDAPWGYNIWSSVTGTGSAARIARPGAIAVGPDGTIFAADWNTIFKITPSGVVTTFATFNGATSLATDSAGNVYVTSGSHTISKVTPAGAVTLIAGSGAPGYADLPGTSAQFNYPTGLTVAADGNIYVADQDNNVIRRVTQSGDVTTVAGTTTAGFVDGTGSSARFWKPSAITVDATGTFWITDLYSNSVRKMTSAYSVTTAFGQGFSGDGNVDGTIASAKLYFPKGISAAPNGDVYVVDQNDSVRRIRGTQLTTVAGLAGPLGTTNATGTAARFNKPDGIAIDSAGTIYVADAWNNCIRRITPAGVVSTFAGACGTSTGAFLNGTGTAARFNYPLGLTFGPGGNLYVADEGNCVIRMITPAAVVSTWSGSPGLCSMTNGPAASVRYRNAYDITFDAAGNAYIVDMQAEMIRRVDAVTGEATTYAGINGVSGGIDGPGTSATFNNPYGITIDGSGNLYVSEWYGNRIRKIAPPPDLSTPPTVSTLAGGGGASNPDGIGSAARFSSPQHMTIGPGGDLFVADNGMGSVRRINLATASVTTVGGLTYESGARDGVGLQSSLNGPSAVAFDASGRMFVTENVNSDVREGLPLLADAATVDAASGLMNIARQLDTSPQTATAWQWNVIRRPGGSYTTVSNASLRNPTFTPDADDYYIFEADANQPALDNITRVAFQALCTPPPAPAITSSSANPSCAGANVVLQASAGYSSYLWSTGARTRTITVAPGTATSYTVVGYRNTCASNPSAAWLQNVTIVSAPTSVTTSVNAPNRITVSWTSAGGADHFNVYRASKLCGSGMPYVKIGSTSSTSYDDNTAVPGATYSYYVKGASAGDVCESSPSNCDDAVAYGACSTPPVFAGLTSVTPNSCLLRLSWSAATSGCLTAPGIVYNVYRDASSTFTPGPTNQIASCLTNTFFDDRTAPAGPSYYVVRAEDGSTYGTGTCHSGNEDTNVVRVVGTPAAPVVWTPFYSDNFDGGRPSNPDTYWTASTLVALSTCRPIPIGTNTAFKFGASDCVSMYPSNANSTLRLGQPDPSTGGFVIPANARLRFNKLIQMEATWDGAALYYSTSPAGPWTYIAESPGAPYVATGVYTGTASSQGGRRVWTGTTSLSFSETTVDLTALAGQRVWFQWQFTSDGSINYEGFYLDDVVLESSAPVSCAATPEPVSVLSSTSRNGATDIEFVTPPTNYSSTTLRYQTGLTYPMSTTAGAPAGTWAGAPDAQGTISHIGLVNGTTYSYSAFVANPSGQISPMRTVRGRPIDTSGQVKWVYNTGATATSSPGIKTGAGGFSFVASNDRAFHSFMNGAAGGNWPATWKPFAMNGPSQSRTLWFEMFVSGVKRQVVAVGSHDGRVYLVDANSGAIIWASPILGEMVQASPVAISSVYGAPFSLVMVGSRSADGSSNVYGLHPDDGHIVWSYDDSPALGGDGLPLGIINDAIVFDYAPQPDGWRRLYFTSRANPSGNGKTLWCLKFNQSTVSKDWAVSTAGDIDAFPIPLNGILYVGNTKGEIWAIRKSDQSVVWGPVATNDGDIKVTLWPDVANSRFYFSTTNYLWAIGTDGVIKWQKALPSPSTPNRVGDTIYVGAGDGKLYEISNLLASSAAGLIVKSVTLGDPATPGIAGEPTLDRTNGLVYVGTDSGSVYAVSIPLP